MDKDIPIELIKLQKKKNKSDRNGFKINDIVKIDMLKVKHKVSNCDCEKEMYGIITHTNRYEDENKEVDMQYGLQVLNKNKKLEASFWVLKDCIILAKR